jgi:hypothetical protein
MRDVFVGTVCAIALIPFFYKGYDKWDNRAAKMFAGWRGKLIFTYN